MKLYEIKTNTQYNSTEIYFTAKPEEATRAALKSLKFKWNPKKGCWYGFADVDKVTAALETESAAIIPEASFVDGGGLYDGWEGGNRGKWSSDKELKAYLAADFKKAGIKATIRFNRAGWLTSITCTMTIKADEIKSLDEFRKGYSIGYGWTYYTDENGKHAEIHTDDLYELDESKKAEMIENITATAYKRAVDRLTCSGCGHSDYREILTSAAADRFELLQKIVTSYNSDCSNSMIDYFDRSIYDHYCFKIA